MLPMPTCFNITWHVLQTLQKSHEYTSNAHNSLRKQLSYRDFAQLHWLSISLNQVAGNVHWFQWYFILHTFHSTALRTNPNQIYLAHRTKGQSFFFLFFVLLIQFRCPVLSIDFEENKIAAIGKGMTFIYTVHTLAHKHKHISD